MAKILAFAGSNSSQSINYALVKHTVASLSEHDVQLLNMANYPFPLFSEDLEKKQGYSNSLVEFKDYIRRVDGIVLAVNEHNGNPSAYFKNLVDWLSRLERKFMLNKKVMLMATSKGKGGGKGALQVTQSMLSRFGGEVVSTFSLPEFGQNFASGKGIVDLALDKQHQEAVRMFKERL